MQECRRAGVECIVAPYEADAQLAYLEKEGIVDLVITEDSDLLVFGCKRVLFKMDDAGNGKLIDLERDSLGKANKNLIVSPSPAYIPTTYAGNLVLDFVGFYSGQLSSDVHSLWL
jgi:5'-3' exonuclease